MPKKELEEALKNLSAELNKLDPVEPETKEMLENLVSSIQTKLNTTIENDQKNQLLTKLEEKAIQMEVEHPLISRRIEEIIDILVKLGL